jgi:hypothetical protein
VRRSRLAHPGKLSSIAEWVERAFSSPRWGHRRRRDRSIAPISLDRCARVARARWFSIACGPIDDLRDARNLIDEIGY